MTIVEADAPNTLPEDEQPIITRIDTKDAHIRLFAGRRKVDALPFPTDVKAKIVEGVVAGLKIDEPISIAAAKTLVEEAIARALEHRGSVIPDEYRFAYGVDQNNGDAMALALKDYCGGGLKDPLDLNRLEEVVDANAIRDRYDVWAAKGLNPGMLRMNTGNVLRGKLRNDQQVVIGAQKFGPEPEAPKA